MKKVFIRSAIQNLFNLFKKKQCYADIVSKFQERYDKENLYKSHFDGTVDWYLNPLYHCEAYLSDIPNTQDIFARDLGCGPSSVCYWLRKNDYKWNYMGASDLPQKPDIIFAVNSFCFVPDFQKTLKKYSI